jgi:ligand-binding sensor domain-containing protein
MCRPSISLLLVVTALYAERLPIQVYTAADGLAQVTVHTIHRDRQGFLWMGTSEGLSRYDGYEFVTYRERGRTSQPRIRAVLDAKDGTIWAGGNAGLCRITALVEAPKPYTCTAPFDGADIQSLFEERPGEFLAGTNRGLYRVATSPSVQFTPIPLAAQNGEPGVWAIVPDRSGDLWIGATNGIHRLSGNRSNLRLTARDGLPSEEVLSLAFSPDGRLWAGTEQGLCRIRMDGTRRVVERLFTAKDGLPGITVKAIHIGMQDAMWVGTTSGLAEAIPGADGEITRFRGYSAEHGLSDIDFDTMEDDIAGNLWMGTQRGGAMKLTRDGFTSYGVADGLGASYVMAMLEMRGGQIGAMTRIPGRLYLNLLEGQRFRSVPVPVDESYYTSRWTGWYQVAAETAGGEWWIASERGLLLFPPGWINVPRPPVKIHSARNGLLSDHIYQIFQDSKGGIWVGTRYEAAGIARWDPPTRRFHQFTAADGLPAFQNPQPRLETARPNGFGEDGHGQIWIGWWRSGVLRYAKGRFQFFGVKDGVPPGGIRRIHTDRKGRVWIGSGGGGVARIDNPTVERPVFRTYSPADGLSAAEIQSITEDREGRIYLGHGLGVDRIEPDSPGPLRVRRFTTHDGLAGGEQQTAIRDRHGALWFGSAQGVSRLLPVPDRPRPPLEVFITSVRVNGRAHPLPGGAEQNVELPPVHAMGDQLQIEYAAPQFVPGDEIRYQYRLSAGEPWSAPTTLRSVLLAELPSGAQRFEVKATNGDGVESQAKAVLAFNVIPPFWRRWWFLLSAAAGIAVVVWILHSIDLRRQLEVQAVRMRIARDLHDHVGTGLSQIAVLSEVAQRSADQQPLVQIAEISRELVDSIGDIVWAINPARDNLPDLAQRMRRFAADLLTTRDVELEFEGGEFGKGEGIGPEITTADLPDLPGVLAQCAAPFAMRTRESSDGQGGWRARGGGGGRWCGVRQGSGEGRYRAGQPGGTCPGAGWEHRLAEREGHDGEVARAAT